jgi:hypothetical protein
MTAAAVAAHLSNTVPSRSTSAVKRKEKEKKNKISISLLFFPIIKKERKNQFKSLPFQTESIYIRHRM